MEGREKVRIYQTKYQKKIAEFPSRFNYMKIAFQYGLLNSKEEQLSYYRTMMGEEGEQTVLEYLQKYGKNHWIVVLNLWQNYSGPLESDLILFTKHKMYVFEIKNYLRTFSYEEGVCKINGQIITTNPFHQVRRSTVSLLNMCHHQGHFIEIQGAVIFAGADNHIEIKSDIKDIDIIPRTKLLTYIEDIIHEENQHIERRIDTMNILGTLENYETVDNYRPKPVSNEEVEDIIKGISCEICHVFDIKTRRYTVICNQCQHEENRERAIVRAICDYGVLRFDKELRMGSLFEFLEGQASKKLLRRILKKHFTTVSAGPNTYYLNKRQPFEKIADQFEF